jgi:hypothetical protein
MTRLEFLTYVLQFVSPRGRPWCDTPATQKAALNKYLYAFTERTWCLYSDAETLDLTHAVALYSMFADFSSPMITIDSIIVNSIPLTLTSMELLQRSPTYTTDTVAQPTQYAFLPGATKGQDTVRIYPMPNADITGCLVYGQIGHPQLLTTVADDTKDISIPVDYEDVAAVFCAVKFLFPASAGASDIQLMAQIDGAAAKAMEDLEYRARVTLNQTSIRGLKSAGSRTKLLNTF